MGRNETVVLSKFERKFLIELNLFFSNNSAHVSCFSLGNPVCQNLNILYSVNVWNQGVSVVRIV